MQRRAGIQPRAKLRLEREMEQGRRPGQRTVAADEGETVARRGTWRLTGMRERDAPRQVVVVRISREDRPALHVVRRGDMPSLTLPWPAELPIVIGKEAQRPRGPAVVCQTEERELHGIVDVHEHVELVANASRHAREMRDAGRMMDDELPARRGARPPSRPGGA